MDTLQSDDSDLDEIFASSLAITGKTDDYESTNALAWNKEPVRKPSYQNERPRAERRTVTCRYWARNDMCRNTSAECSYLHERRVIGGVSNPKGTLNSPSNETSRNWIPSKLLKALSVSDLSLPDFLPRIESAQYVASYNLTNEVTNSIFVPGSPRLWSPLQGTIRLDPDCGSYIRDINAAKNPRYPAEPMFRALLAMEPDVGLSKLDVVGCGSTLGNLLRFSEGLFANFQFDVDRVKNTIFFTRKESYFSAVIRNVQGCGHSFPEAYTKWEEDVISSVSHQRIIRYDCGGLNFLVRTESDGCLPTETDIKTQILGNVDPNSPPKANKYSTAKPHDKSVKPGSIFLRYLQDTNKSSYPTDLVQVEARGSKVPQSLIFDLKTRVKGTRRPLDMNEVYRRLWLNQTPYFIFAENSAGTFQPCDIKITAVSEDVSKWETDQTVLLKNYLATVKEIISASRSSKSGKLQIFRRGFGTLEIREREGDEDDVLPVDLQQLWQ